MARVTTLPQMWWPLMKSPSVETPCCAVCGRPYPLEKHHMVRRSAGKLYMAGVEVPKPTITLCGFGNNLSDADGRPYCHGLAHANRLHFRWVDADAGQKGWYLTHVTGGHLEYIVLDEPTPYLRALEMEGWRRVG